MDNISTQLADLAVTRALVLQRVSNGLSKSVSQAYLSVIDDVTKQLKSGDDINIKNVNKIIKELQSRMEVNLDIESDLTKLGISEAQWAQSSVNGAVGIDLMSKLPTEATIAKIVGDSYIEGATINEWFNGVNDSMKNDLKKSVRVGMLEGETTIQIAKRVRDSLGVSLNHADSISRTAVATVSNNARMATYEANDDVMKGWEHLSALDNRTSQVCATRDGATWDLEHKGLNDKGKKFPFQKPPLHFRCRSLLSPLLKSYEELGLMGIDIPEGTRSSMDGSVSSSTTFERWFESKDSKFQETYLGKQRYEMFKAGKITFNDLVGQNGMTLTIRELQLETNVANVAKNMTIKEEINKANNILTKEIKDIKDLKKVEEVIKDKEESFDFFAMLADSQNTTQSEKKENSNISVVDSIIDKIKIDMKVLDEKVYKENSKSVSYGENIQMLTGKTSGSIKNINEAKRARTLQKYADSVQTLEDFKVYMKKNDTFDNVSSELFTSYIDLTSTYSKNSNDNFVKDFESMLSIPKAQVSKMYEQELKSNNKYMANFLYELLKSK